MSVEITIKQKGFFKKPLPLEVILGDNLKYGAYDGLRLAHDEMGNGEFVAYNPQHIARGFSVQWQEGEKQEVYMRLPVPTCAEEVDDYFDTVERISSFWKKADIEIDGNQTTIDEINRGRQSMKEFNLSTLNMYGSGKYGEGVHYIFCAFWPIALGEREKKDLLIQKTLMIFVIIYMKGRALMPIMQNHLFIKKIMKYLECMHLLKRQEASSLIKHMCLLE